MGRIDTFPASTLAVLPKTVLGQVQSTTDGGTTSGTAELELFRLTVIVPAAGRQLRITHKEPSLTLGTSGDTFWLKIYEDGVRIGTHKMTVGPSGQAGGATWFALSSPSAGTHTYIAVVSRDVGTGTITLDRTGTDTVGFLMVEDITGNVNIAPVYSVPVGQLAFAVTTLTSATVYSTQSKVPGCAVSVTVPAGRILRVRARLWVTGASTTVGHQAHVLMDGATEVALGSIHPDNTGHGIPLEFEGIVSPGAGTHLFEVEVQPTAIGSNITVYPVTGIPDKGNWLLIEDITPTPAPATSAPAAQLGYAERTTNYTVGTTITDIPDLTVTVTVPAGRRLKLTAHCGLYNSQAATNQAGWLVIREGSTQLNASSPAMMNATGSYGDSAYLDLTHVLTPSAGTHTYKVSAVFNNTGGVVTAAPTSPAFLLVEDITGVSIPANNYVTAPVTDVAYANTEGVSAAVARADHVHRTNLKMFGGSNANVGAPPALIDAGPFKIQVGTNVLGSNVNGYATVTYPVAFPNGVFGTIVCNGDGDATSWYFPVTDQQLTTFEVRAFDLAGNPVINSGSFRINWIAIGW